MGPGGPAEEALDGRAVLVRGSSATRVRELAVRRVPARLLSCLCGGGHRRGSLPAVRRGPDPGGRLRPAPGEREESTRWHGLSDPNGRGGNEDDDLGARVPAAAPDGALCVHRG